MLMIIFTIITITQTNMCKPLAAQQEAESTGTNQ